MTIYFLFYWILYRIQLAIGIIKIKEREITEEECFIKKRREKFLQSFEKEGENLKTAQ